MESIVKAAVVYVVLLALFLALVANPLVTKLRALHIPRWIGAICNSRRRGAYQSSSSHRNPPFHAGR